MESTYGNRLHPENDPRPELARLIRETVQRGGCVIIPAFAVERTQKLLFMLKELMESGEIPRVPVHADSPMAIQAVNVFLKHSEEFSQQTRQLIAQLRLAAHLGRLLLRLHPGGIEKDQRQPLPDDHRLLQRHGAPAGASCTTCCSACPIRATWCCSSDSRRRGRAASPSRAAPGR